MKSIYTLTLSAKGRGLYSINLRNTILLMQMVKKQVIHIPPQPPMEKDWLLFIRKIVLGENTDFVHGFTFNKEVALAIQYSK